MELVQRCLGAWVAWVRGCVGAAVQRCRAVQKRGLEPVGALASSSSSPSCPSLVQVRLVD